MTPSCLHRLEHRSVIPRKIVKRPSRGELGPWPGEGQTQNQHVFRNCSPFHGAQRDATHRTRLDKCDRMQQVVFVVQKLG